MQGFGFRVSVASRFRDSGLGSWVLGFGGSHGCQPDRRARSRCWRLCFCSALFCRLLLNVGLNYRDVRIQGPLDSLKPCRP